VKARSIAVTLMTALMAVGSSCWLGLAAPAAAGSTQLVGTFELTPGSCAHGKVAGTYLQMILPSGSSSGPFMSNSDSSCSNQAYTIVSGGTDGGLVTGGYQPTPQPPFTASGNARANRITAPAQYEGTAFATATEPVDPQTHTKVSAPTVTNNGGRLSGDLRSFAVTWNNQNFNQGSPKPDGTYPGDTSRPTGTYNAATGAFTLNWTSQVVGGPFDKFTGKWHLVGRFVPAAGSTPTNTSTTHSSHHGSTSGSATTTTSGGSGQTTGTGTTTTTGGSSATKVNGQGTPSLVTKPSGAGSLAPQVASSGAPGAASTTTVSRENWHATWWLIVLAAGIAVLGFGALLGLNRLQRPRTPQASA
jgi:hypothetical protein